MEARRCVVFTGVELAGGTEFATPVEKATTCQVEKAAMDLVRAVTALVEKATVEMEEGGRPR
jgi:hypothetical protein